MRADRRLARARPRAAGSAPPRPRSGGAPDDDHREAVLGRARDRLGRRRRQRALVDHERAVARALREQHAAALRPALAQADGIDVLERVARRARARSPSKSGVGLSAAVSSTRWPPSGVVNTPKPVRRLELVVRDVGGERLVGRRGGEEAVAVDGTSACGRPCWSTCSRAPSSR